MGGLQTSSKALPPQPWSAVLQAALRQNLDVFVVRVFSVFCVPCFLCVLCVFYVFSVLCVTRGGHELPPRHSHGQNTGSAQEAG